MAPMDEVYGLTISVERRGDVVELCLAGELDTSNAARLDEAMDWLRHERERRAGGSIVVDTRPLRFVDVAGHRAIGRVALRPDGTPDPEVICIVGPVVARMRRLLAMATMTGTAA